MTTGLPGRERRVFRSSFARVGAWAWFVIAALNLADIALRGEGKGAAVAAAVVLLVTAVVYVTAFRPLVLATEQGVLLRNMVRDVYVPWGAVTDIDAFDTLRVRTRERVYHSWAVQAPNRTRRKALRQAGLSPEARKAGAKVHEELAGVTHADFVAKQLSEMHRRHRQQAPGNVQIGWARAPVAALAASVLVFALVLAI